MCLSQHPSTRSALAHLARLKSQHRGSPNILHHVVGAERGIAGMVAASVNPLKSAAPPPGRDLANFAPNGLHLSDAGRLALDTLFNAGASTLVAARQLGISQTAATRHRAGWLKRCAITIP